MIRDRIINAVDSYDQQRETKGDLKRELVQIADNYAYEFSTADVAEAKNTTPNNVVYHIKSKNLCDGISIKLKGGSYWMTRTGFDRVVRAIG